MSDKTTKGRTKKQVAKKIPADRYLRDYLNKTLELGKIRLKKHEGGKITTTDQREIKKNDDRKVNILDTYVFKSMANLIYFFEFVNNNPELINTFDDDIEDLFGLKPLTDRKYSTFPRFVRAIIGEGFGDYGDNRFNFRYRLLKFMQSLINQKAMQYYANPDNPEYQKDTRYKTKIWNELSQAEMWMRLSDKFSADETKEPKRIVDV